MRKRSSQRGYSLIEALVAVAIIGVVSLVSVPAFMTMYRSSQLKVSIRTVATDLRAARQRAVSKTRPVKITFNTGTSATTYEIFEANSTGQWTTGAVRKGTLQPKTFFLSSTFTDIGTAQDARVKDDTDALKDVVFMPTGRIWKATSTNTVVIGTSYPLTPNQYTIEFSPSGSIKSY